MAKVTATPQQFGGTISSDALEKLRASGVKDSDIADQMAQSSPGFASQLQRVRMAYPNNPQAATAFLNTRFYGDADYSPSSKKKGIAGRILDRVWQNSVIDVGQSLEDRQLGKQGAFDTTAQVATNLFTGALAPATEAVRSGIGIAGSVAKGADSMLLGGAGLRAVQQVGSDIASSNVGQAIGGAAANLNTVYQNEREINPALRTLEGFGEAAFAASDAAAVGGAYNVGKAGVQQVPQLASSAGQGAKSAAQKVPLVNRIPGLRPDAVAASPADDFARAAGVVGDDLAKPLSAPAQQFTKIGGDERLARFVDQSNPAEKGLMRSMLERQARAGDDIAATVQAKEVVGQHVMSQAGHLVKAKGEIGKRLGNVVKSIGDDTIDLTNTYTEFVDDLAAKGVYIQSDGKILNMSALPDEDVAYIKNVLQWMRPDKQGTVTRSVADAHRYRQKLFAELDLATIRQKPFSQELERFVDDGIRNRILRDITTVHPQYAPLAQAYAKTISPLRNFLKQIGYKGTVDDVTEAGFEGLRTGEVAMRTLGNASARPTQLLDELEQAAIQWGYKSPIRTQRLVKFADELEDLFPVQQTRSLKGEVGRALENIPTSKTGVVRAGLDKAGEVIQKMRGMTPEARIKALRDLLNEMPPSVADDIPGLTSAVDDFVNKAQTDDVAKTFRESREIELKGGAKGRPGIDYAAPVSPQPQAQKSVNGGSVGGVNNPRILTKKEMLDRGADGYLDRAVEMEIPLSKLDGREPVPAMEGGYKKGTKITQPIEAVYDAENDVFTLYSGNHRVRQAEINGQDTINAFVQADDFSKLQSPKGLPRDGATTGIPKTVRVWNKSKFSNDGGYADVPVIRQVDDITLYQGGSGEGRQFWTPDKEYAAQFGDVTAKTGTFYQVDNGNRMTDVYVEVKPNSPSHE